MLSRVACALVLPVAALSGQAPAYTPAYEQGFPAVVSPGRELVLVFVGASGCKPSNAPGMSQAVEQAKVAVAAQARARGLRFAAIGVAEDIRPDSGLAFLGRNGRFDELVVGRAYLNAASSVHTAGRPQNGGGTPQVLVFERDVTFPTASTIRLSAPVYRLELVGSEAILDWAKAGALLQP